jgi:hypothetical protein
MPPVDSAMVKISGKTGVYDDKGTALGYPKGNEGKHEKLLARIRKRMDKAISAEADNRKAALDDRQFKAGNQWPLAIMAQRNQDKRPCLTINKLPVFIHQIVNDQRQNRPSINISPVGDRGDPEGAKMLRGLIRFIERDCAADIAYDTAFDDAVTGGWGYFRVMTEWEASDSMNMVAVIRRVRNPFTVYMDPGCQDPTCGDAKWGLVTEMVARDEFEEKWPDATPMPFTEGSIGESMQSWIQKDEVRVAEYFEIEYDTRTVVELSNGHVGYEDELDEVTEAYLKRGRLKIVDERESRVPKVMWYKVTAVDVLMERRWRGTTIPIIRVVGDETDLEGKVIFSGIVRNAKDPQRQYNYWSTSETELVALAPKAPWIVEEGQIEGHEDEWKNANVKSMPYLSYKGTSVAGTMAPPPQRQQMVQIPVGVVQAKQASSQDMMATTGVRFDPTEGMRIDESGKALREFRRSSDLGSFHYIDNLGRALKRCGEILVELIPQIYDEKRVLTILREDDKEEQIKIDPTMPKGMGEERHPETGKTMKLFNPKFGKYGVTVTIGPSYATKRIEASENMMAFMKALPQTAALVADLFAANQDWPGAEQIAARLAKTVPPQLLAPDIKDMSPQTQALLSSMDGQIKELTQQLQQAMVALGDQQGDRALMQEKIEKDYEARLLKVVADVETKLAALDEKHADNINTHITAQVKEFGAAAAGIGETMQAEMEQRGLPPEAIKHLAEGRHTTFRNGQKWTLKGGVPTRAMEPESKAA